MILLNCTNEGITLIAPDGDERTAWPCGYTIRIETERVNHRNVPISYWGKPYNPTIAMSVKSVVPMLSERPVSITFQQDGQTIPLPPEVYAGAFLIVPRETAVLARQCQSPHIDPACLAARMVWPAFPIYNEGTHGRLNGTVRAYRELHCLEP